MLGAARELRTMDKIDLCDIAAIPALKIDHYKKLVEVFKSALPNLQRRQEPEIQPVAEGVDAQNAMRGLFS